MAAPRIFVSHSHQDNTWCREFVQAMQRADCDVWFDEKGLSGGDVWIQTIQNELQARDIFVVVLSPEAVASQWVQREIQLALATNKRIVPVLYKRVTLGGF